MDEDEKREEPDFIERASRRVSFWGLAIVGFLGIVLAFVASNSSNESHIGAGILLIASMLAFTAIGRIFRRRRGPFGPGRAWSRYGRRMAEEAMRDRKAPLQTQIDPNEPPNA